VPQVAESELRAWRSGSAIIPESGLPIAMVLIVRRCQASGPSRSPKSLPLPLPITEYRLPNTDYRIPNTDYRYRETPRHLERKRGSLIQLPYRTVREYRKVLQNLSWSTPFQRKGVIPPVQYRLSLMVHFVRTRQDHAVMPRLVSQA
jgi:hypothetical protein